MKEIKELIITNELGKVVETNDFKSLTSIRTGGNIDLCYYPKDIDSLAFVYKYIIDNNLKHCIIGNGTNILASDEYYEGVAIILKELPYSLSVNDEILTCSAFYPCSKLANELARLKVGNLAFLCGIPGLLGGAIYNNAGAFGNEIKDFLIDIEVINTNGQIVTISKKELMLGYRNSIFHQTGLIIISARFSVKPNVETKDIIRQNQKQRRETQPNNAYSMGSVFKNNSIYKAWEVIDALGMRGYQVGDFAISMKHANFIINLGRGKTSDCLKIIEIVREKALKELGIILNVEICYID